MGGVYASAIMRNALRLFERFAISAYRGAGRPDIGRESSVSSIAPPSSTGSTRSSCGERISSAGGHAYKTRTARPTTARVREMMTRHWLSPTGRILRAARALQARREAARYRHRDFSKPRGRALRPRTRRCALRQGGHLARELRVAVHGQGRDRVLRILCEPRGDGARAHTHPRGRPDCGGRNGTGGSRSL